MKLFSFLAQKWGVFFYHTIGSLPLRVRRKLGRIMGYLGSVLFLSKERQIIALQAKRFLPEVALPDFPQKVFMYFGQVMLENFNTKPIRKNCHFKIESKSGVTHDDLSLPNGGLLLTAHFGNWDTLGGHITDTATPLFTIGRRARSTLQQAILEQIRAENRLTTLWRDDEHGTKEIVSLFKSGKVVAALIDQDTPVRSVFVNFFGTPAKTPNGIITLAKRFHRPIYTIFLAQESSSTYTIYLERIPEDFTEEQVLSFYHSELESAIRRHPDQWVWFHKRWRTSNDEQRTLGTTEYLSWLKAKLSVLLALLIITCVTGCNLLTTPPSLPKQAQTKAEAGDIDGAIDLYRQHLSERLNEPSREEWENPYFYQILIGDLEANRGRLREARAAYQIARDNGIENSLFLDRIRTLALKMEENQDLEGAMRLLTEFVQEDPTLINESLDRISKKLLKK